MKLATVAVDGGAVWGVVRADSFIPVRADVLADYPSLRAFLGAGRMDRVSGCLDEAKAMPLGTVQLLPPIPNPDKILCIGLNYADHVAEMQKARAGAPTVFTRFADAQVGHGAALLKPLASDMFDYEGELAVVIGKSGRRIAVEDALTHVAGYSCFLDGSVRDWQRATSQFTAGKNFPASGSFGPWMVTADEIPDPQALKLTTRLNGETVQDGTTANMIFPVAELIAHISIFTTLNAGDVIITGTPAGVGFARDPQLFMKDGDVIEVELERIGTLRNPVIAES